MIMQAQTTSMLDDIDAVSPVLERFTQDRLFGDVWKRPDLSLLDRSIVTPTALIARNQTVQMPYYLNLALDNGVPVHLWMVRRGTPASSPKLQDKSSSQACV